nr:serine carboxypeptidase-like 13 [Tanacetum cinerariifolium]
NEVGEGPWMNIKTEVETNSRIPFAHSKSLLSDEIYKSCKDIFHEDYLNVDHNNSLCVHDLQVVAKDVTIVGAHIESKWMLYRCYIDAYVTTVDTFREDLKDKHFPPGNSVLFTLSPVALGRKLEDINVTWAHLEKKRTRLQLYNEVVSRIAHRA